MRTSLLGLALIALAGAGCGSSATGPSSAAPSSSASVVSVSLTLPGVVLIGTPVQATADALFSDGSMVTSGFSFNVSASSIATASGAGLVTGVAAGSVTVTATLKGKSANQTVRVVPDYHGTWTGTYTMDSCTATAPAVCGDQTNLGAFFAAGLGPISMTLTISQTNDSVVAFVDGTRFILTVPGTIASDGSLPLSGTAATLPGVPDQVGIDTWRAALASGRISGPFDFFASGADGTVRIVCTIVSLTRSGS